MTPPAPPCRMTAPIRSRATSTVSLAKNSAVRGRGMDANVRRGRPVLGGILLAAGLLVVLVWWFGRACLPGAWIAPAPTSEDAYMLGTLYESWARQVKGGHLPLWFPEFGAGY